METSELRRKIIDVPVSFRPHRDDLVRFLKEAGDLVMKSPNLVEISGNALFVGDIHGDLAHARSAMLLARKLGVKAVFLGDYVDRGTHQQETVNYLLANKLLDPENVVLLRGNHEFKEINCKWGFADTVMENYDETVYWLYNCVFMGLPHAVLLNGSVFGVHGGISPEIADIGNLRNFPRPGPGIYDPSMGHFWNDPSEEFPGITENNSRRVFHTFGPDVFDDFMDNNGLDLMIRAHQKQLSGAKYYFGGRLISVFSSADHYKGVEPKAVLVEENNEYEILAL